MQQRAKRAAAKRAPVRKSGVVTKRPQDYPRAQFHVDAEMLPNLADRATPQQRALAHTGTPYGRIARRDLHRYYGTLREELAQVRLSEAEALWLIEAAATARADEPLGRQFLQSVASQPEAPPRMRTKLATLGAAQSWALIDAIERYLLAGTGTPRERLEWVGLAQ